MTFGKIAFSVALALVVGACAEDSPPPQQKNADGDLQRVVDQYGADYVGKSVIVVYARDPDGAPLKGCGADFCRGENGIRIIVEEGQARSLEPHAAIVSNSPPFAYFRGKDGTVSHELLRYRPTKDREVWIRRTFGPPLNSVHGEFNLNSNRSVLYVYRAKDEADHVRVYNAVCAYLRTVGLD